MTTRYVQLKGDEAVVKRALAMMAAGFSGELEIASIPAPASFSKHEVERIKEAKQAFDNALLPLLGTPDSAGSYQTTLPLGTLPASKLIDLESIHSRMGRAAFKETAEKLGVRIRRTRGGRYIFQWRGRKADGTHGQIRIKMMPDTKTTFAIHDAHIRCLRYLVEDRGLAKSA